MSVVSASIMCKRGTSWPLKAVRKNKRKKRKKEKGLAVACFRKRVVANLAIARFRKRATITFHLNSSPPPPRPPLLPQIPRPRRRLPNSPSPHFAAVSCRRGRPQPHRLPPRPPSSSPPPPEAALSLTAAARGRPRRHRRRPPPHRRPSPPRTAVARARARPLSPLCKSPTPPPTHLSLHFREKISRAKVCL